MHLTCKNAYPDSRIFSTSELEAMSHSRDEAWLRRLMRDIVQSSLFNHIR